MTEEIKENSVSAMGRCFLLRVGISLLDEQLDDFGLEVALDNDFPLLGRAAYAAAGLEEFGKGFEVVVGADEAADDGHRLAASVILLHLHAQFLLLLGEGLGFGFIVGNVVVVGVGGVDHLQAALPVVVFCYDVYQNILAQSYIYSLIFTIFAQKTFLLMR